MARIKHSHKKVIPQRNLPDTMHMLIKYDTWRWVDLGLIILSFGFLFAGRYLYIPILFIILTIIEILFEIAIRQSNREWQNTAEGREWVRRMTAAGRLFFIPVKLLIFFGALFLLMSG